MFGGLRPQDEAQLASALHLVVVYLLQGVGRACYEGANKAMYAGMFPTKIASAFSNIVMANGFSSAVTFFLIPPLEHVFVTGGATDFGKVLPLAAFCLSLFTIASYTAAETIHRKRNRRNADL